jgi:hypothetical protein
MQISIEKIDGYAHINQWGRKIENY